MKVMIIILAWVLDITLGSPLKYTGLNLAGAEFGSAIPGVYEKDYTFPTHGEVDYFKGKGVNIVRLPFTWERVQLNASGSLNTAYLGYIDEFVQYATGQNVNVILDPHNYARYYGQIIGQSSYGADVLGNLWSQLAQKYSDNSRVFFGLMNEPNGMNTSVWLTDANTAIAAIRATGAKNLILVPGNGYTGASSWSSNYYGTPNSQVMTGIQDSANNFIFEVHQYLDSDGSGTSADCVSTTIGVDRVTSFTAWARTNKYKALLGEFAGGNNATCQQAVSGLLNYMENNQDVWMGWTWWAGGLWWGNYMYNLENTTAGDAPQMAWLVPHLYGATKNNGPKNAVPITILPYILFSLWLLRK